MAKPQFLQCAICGNQQPYEPFVPAVCKSCGSQWLEAKYDYAVFKRNILRGLPDRPRNLWRFQDVLPLENPSALDLYPAGGTPLWLSQRFATKLGHDRVYFKDERYGPTSSFKDRQAAVAVAAMNENNIREAVIASTGNAAVAYAAACARAGIKLWVFMTSLVPQEKLREAALFGAEVIRVSGNYDQTKQIASQFAQRRNLHLDRGASSIAARESMKTISYEIVEQLGWRAPDWYIQAVSGGMGPLGVYQGFKEMLDMGLIDRIPKIAIIQAEGCSPMVKAFKADKEVADPVVPDTRIIILSTGDPGKTYTYLYGILKKHGGTMESVTDAEAFDAMRSLAKSEGMAVEPATAVAYAGLEKMLREKIITKDETVVVNCTGHTFPVEKHVLGDQWAVDVHLSKDQSPAPQEGLQAALENLDEKATTVLLVDDNSDDALLIRRLLEGKKSYRVYHAKDGWEGLAMARQHLPDLIISDLTMPGIDGFGFVEELKLDPRTKEIPVVVVSAKDITAEERQRLNGRIEALYQKGSLPTRKFVDKVINVIEDKNGA
ncbi:MAG TPA: pyridoxal-phosphate dependent enzyme [Anaerolineales bacterium]|nr:pyridoxal-phosphate dependent enzyme [Anaerolineales bacterium]HMV96687.1 pyridoxal-phosphate dependent enzyme [Anaerolineales bacterium]HMX20520.1 pyridoxal-phosphate dependent enzyme [Anaerolineales bacterium]HMX75165.1 pyridoxal-phosphate dependent enzyme [Anaerolineales bacterium]HMZ44250.1 pyridoxal-phosphate dependent enzyme [Anaerolineales bacterium]